MRDAASAQVDLLEEKLEERKSILQVMADGGWWMVDGGWWMVEGGGWRVDGGGWMVMI